MNFNFEQLIAGALLRFGLVDNFTLLFLSQSVGNQGLDFKELNQYIDYEDGVLILKKDPDYSAQLDRLAGSSAKKFIDSLDLKELVMRKVAYKSSEGKGGIVFNDVENTVKEQLWSEGYIGSFVDEEEDITFKALGYLYMKDNSSAVAEFKRVLEELGINTEYLEKYFSYQITADGYTLSFKDIIAYKNFALLQDEEKKRRN